jgi:Ca-activated chloride channel family protein
MTFIWPLALLSLIFIPILFVAYLRLQRKRARIMQQYGTLGQFQASSGQRMGFSRHVPTLLMLAGLAVLFVGAARPEAQVRLPRIEGTVILAFDVSGSMAAADIQPTRMEAAKAAARAFIQDQPIGVQIGIVAFSDSGLSVLAPTDDKDQALAAINRLSPQKGTSLANGILASLKAIQTTLSDNSTHFYSNQPPDQSAPTPVPPGQYQSASIVLLTDGENNEQPDPLAAAQTAHNMGVRVYTVGLGSPAGADLHINGFTVHTQLDEATLQQVAQMTGGTYYNAPTAQDLHKVYDNLDPQLSIKPEKTEITALFAGASAVLLLLGGLLSLLWFSRLP